MRSWMLTAALTLLLAGCGGALPGTGAGSADGGCPLDATDLSAATSLTWRLATTRTGEPHVTLPSVVLDTTCVFTADGTTTEFGDPLVLRVDVVTGGDVAAVRESFDSVCTDNGGAVSPSSGTKGAQVCTDGGFVQDGIVASDDRSVQVYYPAVGRSQQRQLTSSFGKVLAAVR